MKQRFTALDVRSIVTAFKQRLVGLRLQGIFDVNSKTYLLKFTKPDCKELVIIESGIRIHTTEYTRDKSITPSTFCMKLRKHLKARRLTGVRQLGMDRVIDFEFAAAAGAEAEGTYHIICEFYASGNIILTDHNYDILTLLRVVHIEDEKTFAVGMRYKLGGERDIEPVDAVQLVEYLQKAGPKDNLKRMLSLYGTYGPSLSEHVILLAGLNPTLKVATAMDLSPQSPQITALVDAYGKALDIVERLGREVCPGYISFLPQKEGDDDEVFDEFGPWLFEQYRNRQYREFPSFSDAADVFFSNIEAQKLKSKAHQQELAAERKLESIKQEHQGRVAALEKMHRKTEEQARRIEMNLEFVDQAILIIRQAVAAGMDWQELDELVRDQRDEGNPVAERIVKLNLSINQITLELDDPNSIEDESDSSSDDEGDQDEFSGPLLVDVDIFETAFGNAQRYYNFRRQAGIKHAKTLAVSSQALQSAEQKIQSDLRATKITATVSQMRKPLWFEKFAWFMSSDGYLVLAGHDMQQNELLVKRHLRPGDAYVHADIHGAASVIVKNKMSAAPESTSLTDKVLAENKPKGELSAQSIPPSTLFQAGIMSVCQSRAWDAKILTPAWWVEAHQVSKTAPTGEYLGTGSFMVRGKKHFLPPTQLVYGFGVLFRLADDESIARHAAARKQRQAIMEENMRSAGVSNASETASTEKEAAVETTADDDKNYTVVGDSADLAAARAKYNLDEIEMATEDAFKDADNVSIVATDPKRRTTAKQRRDQRKQKDSTGEQQQKEPAVGKLSKKEQRRLAEEAKYEKQAQQKQKQQPQKRGKKGKMKKMKEKYADQDEEDRNIRMALLGATGTKEDIDKPTAYADSDPVESAVKQQQPPSIVDQLKALTVKEDQIEPKPVTKDSKEAGDEEEADVVELPIEQLNVLDTLTASPLPGDNLSFAIPVCAPYPALSAYKYRVKLVPGTMKKGKACKMAQTVMLTAADGNKPRSTHSKDADEAERLELESILASREKTLIKGIPDTEMIAQMLGKVKVTAPNIESIKQKSKAAAKSKAKAKSKAQ
ncbi:hypothetical protein IWW36_001513 [Coemansia brasiliensis]|uniref:NFACT RNA-binding domain-containing protein n=1 Tax=Coemansia brasiliensis TaxID=2650707 RepID=A0A9W8IBD0_9FUNG|nr:hypothetical protein IWW36_001513 [Coemansia brasiliensis]